MRHTPPTLARLMLSAALHEDDRDYALADLAEEFEERARSGGTFRARWWYRRQVLSSLIPALKGRVLRRGSGPVFSGLPGDLRLAVRTLARTPGHLILTVLSLGVGVGGVTIVVALIGDVVLRPPVGLERPEELVTVYRSDSESPWSTLEWADYEAIASEVPGLEQVAALRPKGASMDGPFDPTAVLAEAVTPNFFEVTGIRPALGRAFTEAEILGGGDSRVAVLGHDLWVRRLGSSLDAIGMSVRIDGIPFTVIGIGPDGVNNRRVPLETDVWIPLGTADGPAWLTKGFLDTPDSREVVAFARITPGATLESLQGRLDVLGARLAAERPESWTLDGQPTQVLTVASESASRVNPQARALFIGIGVFFLTIAAVILLLACANIAGLYLARARKRRAEFAVRLSLGASRSRLVSMMLAEGLVPGALGGLLGIGITVWATRALRSVALPVQVPVRLDVEVTPLVLGAGFVVSLLATLAFSLIPAIGSSKPDLVASLKDEGGAGPLGRRLFSARNLLVITQCAASAMLLVGANLFLKTLSNATEMDLGFDPTGVAVVTHRLPAGLDAEAGATELRTIRERLQAAPGVEQVAMAGQLELTLFQSPDPSPVTVAGRDVTDVEGEPVFHNAVTPGYLEMLRVPLIAGRTLIEADDASARRVAVVNEVFAERYWPGEDPIGRNFTVGPAESAETIEVVGLTRTGKYLDFDDDPTPYYWTSLYQDPRTHVAVALKGQGDPGSFLPLLRREVPPPEGEVQLLPPSRLEEQVSIQFLHLRVASGLLGWAGLFGLLLASIGIYGVVSFSVAQRAREVAIRVALGAEKGRVVRRVAFDGIKLALLGLTVGVVVVIPLARLARGIFYGVSPADPVALLLGVGTLAAVALVASLVPAARVTRVDPMATLRSE